MPRVLGQSVAGLAVIVAVVAAYVVITYCLILLRVYAPRGGARRFRLRMGSLTQWLDEHPFVPLPLALAILLAVVGFAVPPTLARWLLFGFGSLGVAGAFAIGLHEPAWARRARTWVTSAHAYVPGRSERIECCCRYLHDRPLHGVCDRDRTHTSHVYDLCHRARCSFGTTLTSAEADVKLDTAITWVDSTRFARTGRPA